MNLKKLKFLQFLGKQKTLQKILPQSQNDDNCQMEQISSNLKKNTVAIQKVLGKSSDIIYHQLSMGTEGEPQALLIMIQGMVNKEIVNNYILKPLIIDSRNLKNSDTSGNLPSYDITKIKNSLLTVGNIKESKDLTEIVEAILAGNTALLIDGLEKALIIGTFGVKSRDIQQPESEASVRGPHESFTENLTDNTALIRRRLKNPSFTVETMAIGTITKTNINIIYLKGIVKPGLINEIKERLERIDTDAILESGYIEQYIEDAPFSPFSTIGNTERPDVVAAKLLEGRAAILTDGTPMVLTIPMVFLESFQVPEDYYSRPYYVSIVRSLRFLSFFISIFGPAAFVALTSYHHELIPTPLLLTMAAAREGTPFPAAIEAIFMGIAFEILREAGIRLPRPVGTAISIVGALVIGEAVVSAGLVSAPMVIVVAITAISSFVVPPQADVGGVARIIFVLLAGFMGAFGIMIGFLGGLVHMCALRSFGTPYLAPFAPLIFKDLKDTVLRFPLWSMLTRPANMGLSNPVRKGLTNLPTPPQTAEENGNDTHPPSGREKEEHTAKKRTKE